MNQIAYKFVSWDVPALESLAGSKAYILRKRLNDGGTLTREEKDWITREVNHNTYFKDSIPLLGYRFNFVDVLKTFVVKQYVEKPLNFDPFGHARFAHLFVLYD